ncbi:MAG: TolC family protein [Ignavibacteriales bacterium]|nr:TolC family protein [Ignavibacteriales bacterium]
MNKRIVLSIVVLLSLYNYAQVITTGLSISAAVALGLKNNPSIKKAQQAAYAAEGRYHSGISLPQPEFSFSYEYAPVSKSLSNYSEKSIGVSQSFDFPLSYFLRSKKLTKEQSIAARSLQITERNIIHEVKAHYYKVLVKQYQLQYANDYLSIAGDFLKKAEIRQNIGDGTNLERLTAKVQFTEAQNNLAVAKNELTIAQAELRYAIGYERKGTAADFVLTDSLYFSGSTIALGEVLENFNEAQNLQMQIAGLQTGIAAVEQSLAWSSVLPVFNLSYFRQSRDGNNGFYGASFGMSVPLWFMFEQKGKIEEANANFSAAGYEMQSIKTEMQLKLHDACTALDNNEKQVRLYISELLPQAAEIFTAAEKSYDAGELTYIEYMQAKQILISSRNNYINALYNYYLSVLTIEELTGLTIIDNKELDK